MSIKQGDTVKITTKNSTYEGRTGKVVHVFDDENTVTVTFDPESGLISGFFVSELEVLKGVDEDEQIEKLATVLVSEGGFPSHKSALEAARSLYKAGVRANG